MNAGRRVFLTFVLLLTPIALAVPCSAQVNLEQPYLLLLAASEGSLQESLDNAASKILLERAPKSDLKGSHFTRTQFLPPLVSYRSDERPAPGFFLLRSLFL